MISSTIATGTTNVWPPHSNENASTMVMVSGMRSDEGRALAGAVRSDSSPPSSSTMRLTMSMPIPRPLVVVTWLRVDSPGAASSASSASSLVRQPARRPGARPPRRRCRARRRDRQLELVVRALEAASTRDDADLAACRPRAARRAARARDRRRCAPGGRWPGRSARPPPCRARRCRCPSPGARPCPSTRLRPRTRSGTRSSSSATETMRARMIEARRSRSWRPFSATICASARTSAPPARSSASARVRRKRVTTSADSFSSASSRRLTSTRTMPRPRTASSSIGVVVLEAGAAVGAAGASSRTGDQRLPASRPPRRRPPRRRRASVSTISANARPPGASRPGGTERGTTFTISASAPTRSRTVVMLMPAAGARRRGDELERSRAPAARRSPAPAARARRVLSLAHSSARQRRRRGRGGAGRRPPAGARPAPRAAPAGAARDRLALGQRRDPLLDRPHPLEQQVHRAVGQPARRAIGVAQHRLHRVGDVDDRLDADHRRQPLDGVQRAEQLAHLARASTGRWRRPARRTAGWRSPAPGAPRPRREAGEELRRRRSPSSRASLLGAASSSARTSARIASGENGLVMKRVAPAASARAREPSSPRVVTTRMGSARSLSWPRTNSITSKPPMSGMLRSSTTTSKRLSDSRSIASSPLAACVNARSSQARRQAMIISRITLLSSTIRASAISAIFDAGRCGTGAVEP